MTNKTTIDKSVLLAAMQKNVQQTNVTLSDGRKIKVRAFLMKEMKLLMLANEANTGIDDAIIQIVKNCILTDNVDVDLLPVFDLEAVYLALYKLSKASPTVPVMFTCANEILDEDGNVQYDQYGEIVRCGSDIKVNVNLNNAKLSDAPDNKIVLNENMTVYMRYPNISEVEYFNVEVESDLFNLINRCIDEVHMGDQVVKVGVDIPYEDISEIMEYADSVALTKMGKFVTSLPQHTLNIPVKCKKCGHQEIVTLKGVESFFA
ncbi:baseplate hub subunit [Aeromonas phage AS-yj]|uniref:Baseplate hub subunit n=2 Tax=Ceceduovirus aszj TaxID=2843652 RepID=A0A411B891_9CAUD|nr:baseplate hub subunit [Aeromonas phage AS-yj]QAX97834.1 baseplate hub subunit [Aeromonas phage Asswx_1]